MLFMGILCGALYAATPISQNANKLATITGHITDSKGMALIGATVYIPELQRGTTTDVHGQYTLTKLPMGRNLHVRYAYVGYETLIKQGRLTQEVVTWDITLHSSVIQTEDVVITGGYITSQHENAVKIDIVRPDDLQSTPNLTQALAQVPGVDIISKGNGPAKPVIHGLWGNNIMVLQDGIKVENYQFSENHPMSVDNTNLGHVEVIKGPASLLYGSDAIGGVINFVAAPLAPVGTVQGRVTSQAFSATKGWNTLAEINTTQGNISGGLSVKRNQHEDYRQGNGKDAKNTRFNQLNMKGYLSYALPIGVFKLTAEQYDQQLGMCVGAAQNLVTYNSHHNDVWYQDLRRRVVTSQNTLYLGRVKWNVKGAFQESNRQLQTNGVNPEIEMKLRTYTLDSKWNVPVCDQSSFIFGAQGMWQNNKNLHDRNTILLPNADINSFGLVGLYQTKIGSRWNMQGGLRYDWYHVDTETVGEANDAAYRPALNRRYHNLSGDISANYRPDEHWTLRLNVARAFRVPNLSELTSNGSHGARIELGNADLETQDATNVDVSAHYHSRLVTFDVAAFYNNIKHYIYVQSTGNFSESGSPIYQYQQNDARLYGGEAGLHVHPSMIPWLHVKSTYSYVVGKQKGGEYLPFIPAQKIRSEVRADLPSTGFFKNNQISINNLAALCQDKPNVFETETPGYAIWGMKASTKMHIERQPIELSLSADNLLDKTYFDHLSTLKPMNIYNPGRSVMLSITVPFE